MGKSRRQWEVTGFGNAVLRLLRLGMGPDRENGIEMDMEREFWEGNTPTDHPSVENRCDPQSAHPIIPSPHS